MIREQPFLLASGPWVEVRDGDPTAAALFELVKLLAILVIFAVCMPLLVIVWVLRQAGGLFRGDRRP